ncbi:hypothetical protein [Paraburkholderia kururiensis]|uniref:hypothetical protein n=1 Tax=Paraburkholderia kururiensis TaxID=984307 RepID=UPI000F890907|nr:hypothetical protein [Paraburkholderia kururiensis]
MNQPKFETRWAQELHARIQTMTAIQKARGDTARWHLEERRRFWKSTLPLIGLVVVLPTALYAAFTMHSGDDPSWGISGGVLLALILIFKTYPRA